MAKNEQTSAKMASLAAKVLSGAKKPTPKEVKQIAGALLTQTPDHKKPGRK